MQYKSLMLAALACVTCNALPAEAIKRSTGVIERDGRFHVEGASFAHQATYTFENGIPDGLAVSNEPGPPGAAFVSANARVANGYLELLMQGGQTAKPYNGGQVYTRERGIKHASVRTTAILSEPAGVCNGMFFYESDTQEIDIEWLSDANSESNGGSRKIWFTNQDANGDGRKSYQAVEPPSDATSVEHEYRVDWTDGRVQFFIDGEQKWETNQDVPTTAGPWIWNNWANGDRGWTVGPPAQDAVFKIRRIEMYYDTA